MGFFPSGCVCSVREKLVNRLSTVLRVEGSDNSFAGLQGSDLSKLKLPSSIKVSPTRVFPESLWMDNWD